MFTLNPWVPLGMCISFTYYLVQKLRKHSFKNNTRITS